jgi:Holliday junction resolvase RusA-like endonuclease
MTAFVDINRDALAGLPELPAGSSSPSQVSGAAGSSPVPAALFSIPAPPSVNAMYRNLAGKGRVKTKTYSDWRAAAITFIRSQRVKNVSGPAVVLVAVERHSLQADIDNRNKAILDLMVAAGVLNDDSDVTAILSTWAPSANHTAHVAVYKCEPMTFAFHPSRNGASGALVAFAPYNQGDD